VAVTPDLDWEVAEIDDFTGDGRADILLRNQVRGLWRMHEMNGKTVLRNDNFGGDTINRDLNWQMQ